MKPRIVSLIPSATEIIASLGYADCLVGRSHECDYPASVEALPILTRPKVDPKKPSGQIDRDVRALLEGALAVYEVDAKLLAELKPDLVVTQSQCEVCAVSLADVERALGTWTQGAPKLVSLSPVTLEEALGDIQGVADTLGDSAAGRRVVNDARRRYRAIAERAKAQPQRPRVASLEWLDPLMGAGNWLPELVELAGGEPLLGQAGKHSAWSSWEELLAADPDKLVILPCGFDIARARAELPVLTQDPRWQELSAVKMGEVYVTDGNAFFNRPGPRLVESAEILAEILHPGVFDFGHKAKAWQKL